MTTRRTLLLALGAGACAAPLGLFAQAPGGMRSVGLLFVGSPQSWTDSGRRAAFLDGMRDLGYVEGRNFAIEGRFGDDKTERLPELAAQLVRFKVDVIVTDSTSATLAAQRATSAVPSAPGAAGARVGEVTSR